jgi:hypothetical protein
MILRIWCSRSVKGQMWVEQAKSICLAHGVPVNKWSGGTLVGKLVAMMWRRMSFEEWLPWRDLYGKYEKVYDQEVEYVNLKPKVRKGSRGEEDEPGTSQIVDVVSVSQLGLAWVSKISS